MVMAGVTALAYIGDRLAEDYPPNSDLVKSQATGSVPSVLMQALGSFASFPHLKNADNYEISDSLSFIILRFFRRT